MSTELLRGTTPGVAGGTATNDSGSDTASGTATTTTDGDARDEPANRTHSVAQLVAWLARQSESALAAVELTLPQFRVLALLSRRDALPSWLADRLDVGRPSITAVVDGLVTRGLVVRLRDESDRRKVTHVITPEGRKVLERAEACVAGRLEEIAGALSSDADRVAAFDGLERWGTALAAWWGQLHAEHGDPRPGDEERRGSACETKG